MHKFNLNAPASLFGFIQASIEFPIDFDLVFNLINILTISESEGGNLLVHRKYYFSPGFGVLPYGE